MCYNLLQQGNACCYLFKKEVITMVEAIQSLVDAIGNWFKDVFGADSPIVDAIAKIIGLIIAGYVDV